MEFEKQRRFNIKNKESFKNMDEVQKNIVLDKIAVGGFTISAILFSAISGFKDTELPLKIIHGCLGIGSMAIAASSCFDLIDSLSKKTRLNKRSEEIVEDLEGLEKREKGISK